MVRHVVLLTLLPGTSEAAVDSLVAEVATLPDLVPSVRGYSVGRDLGLDDENATVAIVADFDDEAGYATYRDHPEHQRVIREHIRPVLAERRAAQTRTDRSA